MPRAKVMPKPAAQKFAANMRVDSPHDDGASFEQGALREQADDMRRQLNSCPFLNGRQLAEQSIASGVTSSIAHGLSGQPRGYLVTRLTGGAPDLRWQSWDKTFIVIKNYGGGTAVFDLWVY